MPWYNDIRGNEWQIASKKLLPEKAMEASKRNNRDLNRDWTIPYLLEWFNSGLYFADFEQLFSVTLVDCWTKMASMSSQFLATFAKLFSAVLKWRVYMTVRTFT